MKIEPVQITFRNLEPSAAVADRIRAETAKLERAYDRITSCHVLVEAPHRHQKWGEEFLIRIELVVPGEELVIKTAAAPRRAPKADEEGLAKKRPQGGNRHKDLYVTIGDAFKAARRRLETHARKLRGEVKLHGRINPTRREKIAAETLRV